MNVNEIEQSLKAKLLTFNTAELIKIMPTGLRNRHTQIDMKSFGRTDNEVCFGCAAANAILEILKIPAYTYISGKQEDEDGNPKILLALEFFFDDLRRGEHYYLQVDKFLTFLNSCLGKEGHFQPIKYPEGLEVPKLTNHFTEEHLQAYEKLADFQ